MRYAVIIPARYESSRLPGKPLVDLDGLPMIVRTYKQCIKACPDENVYVATDDTRVMDVCEEYGIKTLLTSNTCLTGTDRVAECARMLDADVFINVQGDEPVFNPDDLALMIKAAEEYPGVVLNGVCEIQEEEQFRNKTIPKVVMRGDGLLLYMSRAPIPTTKTHSFTKAWRQVCVYVFPKDVLEIYAENEIKTPLEAIEDIEILRFLELGINVRMIPLSEASMAVDVPEDVERVVASIKERGL